MRAGWSSASAARRDRARTLILISLALLLVIGMRLFYLQVVQAGEFQALAESNFLRPEVIPAMRGIIRDRDGVLLANSIPSFTASIDPWHDSLRGGRGARGAGQAQLEETVRVLAPMLDAEADDILAQVRKQRRGSYHPVRVKRNLDMETVSRIAENRHRLPGVIVEIEPLRSYPFAETGAHLLGYINEVSDDEIETLRGQGYFPGASIGRAGVELQYEEALKGEDGIRYVEVNALGRRSNYFTSIPPILPRKGRDITLTVDWDLQLAAETALDTIGWSEDGPAPEVKGAVVALDPRNGEVLALVSRPAYDPNQFATGFSQAEWQELNRPGRFPLLNRAVQSRYPPGSTFKPVTVIAGLMGNKLTPSSTFQPCTGAYKYGRRWFKCWRAGGHGVCNAVRSLTVSCDVYYYQIGNLLGVDGIAETARKMWVPEPTGIDLPRERAGLVPDTEWYDDRYGSKGWSRGAALNLSIGQGEILMTPVGIGSFAASLATGNVPRLHVVREMSTTPGSDPFVPPTSPRGRLDVDPAGLELVRRGMVEVVQGREGTGKYAAIEGVTVAGKTGSAEHSGDPTHALFIAYAPVETPQIVVAVVLESRGGGGSFAAPVAHEIMNRYFHPEATVPAAGDTLSQAVNEAAPGGPGAGERP